MYTRVVTFTGANDIDAGVDYVRQRVLPILRDKKGYRGMTASADRDAGVFAVLTLWDTAADRDATESAMAPIRQEATEIIGGRMDVEMFEQVAAELGDTPPGPGSALMVTRVSMDPGKVDENVEFFTSEVMPRIKASPGFQGLRHMVNRDTGGALVGTVWSDDADRKEASDDAMARRQEAVARGVSFDDVSHREILLAEMP
jgi:heme-degrading monooxygenase HmoA